MSTQTQNSTRKIFILKMGRFTKSIIHNSNKIIIATTILFLFAFMYILFFNKPQTHSNIPKKTSTITQYSAATKLEKLGDSLVKIQDNFAAINYFRQAFELLNGDTLYKRKAELLNKIGLSYHKEGLNEEALTEQFNALSILKSSDNDLIAKINYDVSNVYLTKQLLQKSLEKINLALNFYNAEPAKYKLQLASAYNNKSIVFLNMGLLDSCKYYSKASLKYVDKANSHLYPSILMQIGVTFFNNNQLDSGLFYYNLAKQISLQNNDSVNLATYYGNISYLDFQKNNMKEAISKVYKAIDYQPKVNTAFNFHNIMQLYKILVIFYEKTGEFKQANYYNKKLRIFSDSLNSIKAVKYIADIENDYRIKRKNMELKELELNKSLLTKDIENKQKQKYLLIAFLILTFITGLYVFKVLSSSVIRSELKEDLLKKNNLILENEKRLIESDKLILEKDNLLLENQNELLEKDKILLENEKQLVENEKTLVNNELDKIKKELEYNSSLIDEKETLIHDLEDKLLASIPKEFDQKELVAIIDSVKEGLKQEKENLGVDIMLNESNVQFFKKLKEKHPDISKTEARLCTLLYLNLETKELARIMNISIEGVRKGKHRLRKRMELDAASNITDYLQAI